MPDRDRLGFAASLRAPPPIPSSGKVAPQEDILVSLYLTPAVPPRSTAPAIISRADLAEREGDRLAGAIARVSAFARASGLRVERVDPARRLVQIRGTAAALEAAFDTELLSYGPDDARFRGRQGMLSVPPDLIDIVDAILGLDNRPLQRSRMLHPHDAAGSTGLWPNRIAELYGCPPDRAAGNQTLAVIELGGGYRDSDNLSAFAAMGLAVPAIEVVSVRGATNDPEKLFGANETALDIQVLGGTAVGAKIVVYFSEDSEAGFADALSAAVHDDVRRPAIVSISWGCPEESWTRQSIDAINAILQDAAELGISVFCSSGDRLATSGFHDGKAHVNFPASSPWAIGCGGTALTVAGEAIAGEVVWNDGAAGTGGGISSLFDVPDYQKAIPLPVHATSGRPGRGLPDLAASASGAFGFNVVLDGKTVIGCGTSASTPLWAGIVALLNARRRQPLGFFLAAAYACKDAPCRAVTQGHNRPAGSAIGYDAAAGWNPCTGLGTPDMAKLVAAFVPPDTAKA